MNKIIVDNTPITTNIRVDGAALNPIIISNKAKADLEFKHNALWREYIHSPCGKYCYLINAKNASNTFRRELRKLDWRSHRWDPKAEFYLSHLGDPIDRWVKGFSQFCLTNHIDVATVLTDKNFLIPGIFDNHTMPVSHTWCDLFYKIHFFKLGTTGLEDFIRPDYDLTVTHRLNAADKSKENDYNLIRHAIRNKMPALTSFLYHDLIKYNDLSGKPIAV